MTNAEEFDEDKELKQLMDSQSSKPQLIKNVLLGCVSLVGFAAFMAWPEAWVAVLSVITVVTLAYASEMCKSASAVVPCRGRSVLITGCDTGRDRTQYLVTV